MPKSFLSPVALYQSTLTIDTRGEGLAEITEAVTRELKRSQLTSGIATIFCQHTSCSLVIMENADETARADLVAWLNRLVPENDPHFTHTAGGPDDMPSHIKMALTRTSETVPFVHGRLQLGTWQGIFLWEHRRRPHRRHLVLTFIGG